MIDDELAQQHALEALVNGDGASILAGQNTEGRLPAAQSCAQDAKSPINQAIVTAEVLDMLYDVSDSLRTAQKQYEEGTLLLSQAQAAQSNTTTQQLSWIKSTCSSAQQVIDELACSLAPAACSTISGSAAAEDNVGPEQEQNNHSQQRTDWGHLGILDVACVEPSAASGYSCLSPRASPRRAQQQTKPPSTPKHAHVGWGSATGDDETSTAKSGWRGMMTHWRHKAIMSKARQQEIEQQDIEQLVQERCREAAARRIQRAWRVYRICLERQATQELDERIRQTMTSASYRTTISPTLSSSLKTNEDDSEQKQSGAVKPVSEHVSCKGSTSNSCNASKGKLLVSERCETATAVEPSNTEAMSMAAAAANSCDSAVVRQSHVKTSITKLETAPNEPAVGKRQSSSITAVCDRLAKATVAPLVSKWRKGVVVAMAACNLLHAGQHFASSHSTAAASSSTPAAEQVALTKPPQPASQLGQILPYGASQSTGYGTLHLHAGQTGKTAASLEHPNHDGSLLSAAPGSGDVAMLRGAVSDTSAASGALRDEQHCGIGSYSCVGMLSGGVPVANSDECLLAGQALSEAAVQGHQAAHEASLSGGCIDAAADTTLHTAGHVSNITLCCLEENCNLSLDATSPSAAVAEVGSCRPQKDILAASVPQAPYPDALREYISSNGRDSHDARNRQGSHPTAMQQLQPSAENSAGQQLQGLAQEHKVSFELVPSMSAVEIPAAQQQVLYSQHSNSSALKQQQQDTERSQCSTAAGQQMSAGRILHPWLGMHQSTVAALQQASSSTGHPSTTGMGTASGLKCLTTVIPGDGSLISSTGSSRQYTGAGKKPINGLTKAVKHDSGSSHLPLMHSEVTPTAIGVLNNIILAQLDSAVEELVSSAAGGGAHRHDYKTAAADGAVDRPGQHSRQVAAVQPTTLELGLHGLAPISACEGPGTAATGRRYRTSNDSSSNSQTLRHSCFEFEGLPYKSTIQQSAQLPQLGEPYHEHEKARQHGALVAGRLSRSSDSATAAVEAGKAVPAKLWHSCDSWVRAPSPHTATVSSRSSNVRHSCDGWPGFADGDEFAVTPRQHSDSALQRGQHRLPIGGLSRMAVGPLQRGRSLDPGFAAAAAAAAEPELSTSLHRNRSLSLLSRTTSMQQSLLLTNAHQQSAESATMVSQLPLSKTGAAAFVETASPGSSRVHTPCCTSPVQLQFPEMAAVANPARGSRLSSHNSMHNSGNTFPSGCSSSDSSANNSRSNSPVLGGLLAAGVAASAIAGSSRQGRLLRAGAAAGRAVALASQGRTASEPLLQGYPMLTASLQATRSANKECKLGGRRSCQ